MPSPGEVFQSRVSVTLGRVYSERELGTLIGTIAKTRHEQLIAQGRVSSVFQRYVDGQLGKPETAIRVTRDKPGEIRYVGSSLLAAVIFARQLVKEASPVGPGPYGAGTYRDSWIIAIDGQVYRGDITKLPSNAVQAIIVNITPYARRLEQSFARTRPGYRVTQIVADTTKRRFAGLDVRRKFVTLPSISNGRWQIPYILKNPPGGEVLYPAVQIEVK